MFSQEGEHSSVQDAQATMRLFTMVRKDWENELLKKRQKNLNENALKIDNDEKKIPLVTNKKSKNKNKKKIANKPTIAPQDSTRRLQYEDSDSD